MDLVEVLAEIQLRREAREDTRVEAVETGQVLIRIRNVFFKRQDARLGERQLGDDITGRQTALVKASTTPKPSKDPTNLSSCRQLQKAYTI